MQIWCSPQRGIQMIISGPRGPASRSVKRLKINKVEQVRRADFGKEAHCELDTRADTCCVRTNCHPIFYTGQQCAVQGFHDGFAPVPNVPFATFVTTWSDPLTRKGYILIIHEALYFGNTMDHSLINPNQLHHYGIVVHDNPYELDPSRTMGIEIDDDAHLPFQSQGSTVFFTTRYPDDDEMELYPHVVLTSDRPWDPQGLVMPGGLDVSGLPPDDRIIQRLQIDERQGMNRHHLMHETDCVALTVDGNTEQLLLERIINSVHVSTIQHMGKLQLTTRHSQFRLEHVAAIFGVSLGTAKDILAVTTQQHPALRYALNLEVSSGSHPLASYLPQRTLDN
jgi:hypothetical protein